MNVRDVMTSNVKTCLMTDSLNEAARIMWDNDCGVVPVVDEAGKVVGIVTDRDICMAAYTQGRPLWRILVSQVASTNVVTVRANETLHRAEQLMKDGQVRRLPVTDNGGQIVGLLSITDLARHTPEYAGALATHLVGTMVGICRSDRPAEPTKNGSPAPSPAAPRV